MSLKQKLTFLHLRLEHHVANIFDVEEILSFEVSHDFHDVLLFNPNEKHSISHDVIWDDEFLEILDSHTPGLGLGGFVVLTGVASLSFDFLRLFLAQSFLFLLFAIGKEVANFGLFPLGIDVNRLNFFEFDFLHLKFAFFAIPHLLLVLPVETFHFSNFECF